MKKIVLIFLIVFTYNAIEAQPTETIAGRYEDHGFWREHPYTTFDSLFKK